MPNKHSRLLLDTKLFQGYSEWARLRNIGIPGFSVGKFIFPHDTLMNLSSRGLRCAFGFVITPVGLLTATITVSGGPWIEIKRG
jgi:hypothetical protein